MELCRKDAGNYGIPFVDKRLSKAKSTTSLQLVFSLTTFTKEKKNHAIHRYTASSQRYLLTIF